MFQTTAQANEAAAKKKEEEAAAKKAAEDAAKAGTDDGEKETSASSSEEEEFEQEEGSESDADGQDGSEDASDGEPKKKSKGVGKRIDELTRDKYTAIREKEEVKKDRDYWREKALAKEKEKGSSTTDDGFNAPAPKEDDFDTFEEYQEARTDWLVEKKTHEAMLKREKIEAEREQKRKLEENQKEIVRKFDKGREKYSDFDQVALGSHVAISQDMADAIRESDIAHEIAYHLGKNPDEAYRISQLGQIAAAKEIGVIEARLTPPKQKRVSQNTHRPIKPVSSGGTEGVEKDPGDMSPDEYRKWREGK